jgi:cytochrome c oxidase subunit 2
MNALYWVAFSLGVLLLLAINAALIGLAVRYRRGRGRAPRRLRTRGRTLLLAAGGLSAFAAVLFVVGVIFTENASQVEASGPEGLQAAAGKTVQRDIERPSPSDGTPLQIQASGQQWIWRYEYPEGEFSYYELVVPADTAVVVELESTDVVHRWWVPGLGAKVDAVPGQSNRTWFKVSADELSDDPGSDCPDEFTPVGCYQGASYAFSGASYATMRTRVRVLEPAAYEEWLRRQGEEIQAAQSFVQERIASSGGPLGAAQEAAP